MKKILLFVLVLYAFELTAQNYRVVNLNDTVYFQNTDLPFNSTFSQIKATNFHIKNSSSTDTTFESFYSWMDTAFSTDTCVVLNGPSWFGTVVENVNGMTMIISRYNDTTFIAHNANVNDTWNFYKNNSNGDFILARVDSVVLDSFAGITDSVKYISLHCNCPNGNFQWLNGWNIKLSRNNGVVAMPFLFDPYWFAGFYYLQQIPDVQMISTSEVFDFNIGDELEYLNYCSDGHYHSINEYTYKKVLDKWVLNPPDSVCYVFQHNTTSIESTNPWMYDTTFIFRIDTLCYELNTNPLFNTLPEENYFHPYYFYPGSFTADGYLLDLVNNRPEYKLPSGLSYGMLTDSCFRSDLFFPAFVDARIFGFAKGLGETYSLTDAFIMLECEKKLVWYKKGAEVWGNYFNPFVGITENERELAYSVFPNPVHALLTIASISSEQKEVTISDVSGRTVRNFEFNNHFQIDLTSLENGIYIITIQGNNTTTSRRIVKN